MPSPSPTTTSAVKLNRRPPLTTLATRLIVTTRSRCGFFSGAFCPRPPSRRSRRSPRSLPPVRAPRCGPGIRWSLRLRSSCSEFQSGFAGRLGECRDTSGVGVAAPVEDDLAHARRLGGLGDLCAGGLGLGGLVAVGRLEGRGRGERDALAVVHDLREQMTRGAGHDQARTLGRTGELLAQAEVPTRLADPARGRDAGRAAGLLGDGRGAHYFVPAFPALSAA